ncbi:GNAT family N-acetyltransferase [Paraflavitalea speifideaquila]|uniref:GNAT family N-acetyltransferase n=1 Tax=Paraflavitalea speifideaquila TaxID=3076558 RepID=UPI0028EE79DF|nr:GNAT family N-acetyltransferase [Paraflavitalea speifideiaquila]
MITVRLAEEKDLPEILTIYNDIIVNTTAVYDYQPHTAAMRKQWWDTKKEQGFPVYVAEADNKLAGFSSIGPFRAWAAYKYSVENSVYVSSDSRGKGVGKLLMRPLIEAATKLQMHTILAGIDASNEASVRLHEWFGFKEVAHFKQVGYKFGRWLDLKFMQLVLDTPVTPAEK